MVKNENGEGSNAASHWKLPQTPIVLVGLMGAGKSTIGRRLATEIGWPFCDSDEAIEEAADMTIAEIFEQYGEQEFRRLERRVIERLMQNARQVLATGGGAFINQQTRELIKAKSVSVWLHADLDVLVDRVSRRNTRPLLQNGNPRDILSDLIKERYPIYADADLTVDSEASPHAKTVEAVLQAVTNYCATGEDR